MEKGNHKVFMQFHGMIAGFHLWAMVLIAMQCTRVLVSLERVSCGSHRGDGSVQQAGNRLAQWSDADSRFGPHGHQVDSFPEGARALRTKVTGTTEKANLMSELCQQMLTNPETPPTPSNVQRSKAENLSWLI